VNVNAQIDPKFLQESQQFDSIISNLESSKEADTPKEADTQDTSSKEVPSETSGLPPTFRHRNNSQRSFGSNNFASGGYTSIGCLLQPKAQGCNKATAEKEKD